MEALPLSPPPSSLAGAEVQRIRDTEHLRILSIGYYIVGACTALFSSLGLIHLVLGLLIVSGVFPPGPPPPRPLPPRIFQPAATNPPAAVDGQSAISAGPAAPAQAAESFSTPRRPFSPEGEPPPRPQRHDGMPRVMGLLFVVLGGGIVLLGWTLGGLTVYAGRCLQQRRHRTFTYVIAAINCLQLPYGAVLGVCAFIVLGRPSVDLLYHRPGAAAAPIA